MPTDGAVLSVPPLLTFALAILAGAMLHTERVTHTLVTRLACPALLTAARASHTHAMSAAVHRTHLCWDTNPHTHTKKSNEVTQHITPVSNFKEKA